MTAAPGHVNQLVEQIMERLHSAVLEGHSGSGENSPTLTEVLHVSGLSGSEMIKQVPGWSRASVTAVAVNQQQPPLWSKRSIRKPFRPMVKVNVEDL